MANEWVIKVTADVRDVLEASKEIGKAGKQAGENFESGFNGSEKTLSSVKTQLKETTGGARDFGESQKTIAKNQGDVDSALGKGNGILGSLTDGVKSFALQTASVLTVGKALEFAGKQIMDLDTASAAVQTLGVDSGELSKELLKLSIALDSNVSRVELMQASYDVASSGFSKTSEIVDILTASALGATGGFSDLETVANAVTSVINSYGLEASDASSIVDSFIQTQNDGKITVAQFGAQIGNIAAVAAAAGIPLTELSAAISDATAKGVPVEQTFTGLRQAISSIIKPSEQAKEEAEKLGIEYNLTGLQAKGFSGFLADVVAKSKGSADSIAILTGSVEAQAPIQQIANDNLEKYNEFLGNQVNKSGQAKEASEIATATISGGFEKIINASSNLVTVLGTSGGPAIGATFELLATGISLVTALTVKAGEVVQDFFNFLPDSLPIKNLSETYNNVFLDSIKWITGQLSGTEQLTVAQEKQAKVTEEGKQRILEIDVAISKEQLAQLEYQGKIADAQAKLTKAREDGDIQVGQATLNLGKALVDLEDSRYSIVINRNKYELEAAKKRGASEGELEAIKRRGEDLELAAMNAKYQALVKQQKLEEDLLDLKQLQARTEADLAVDKAQAEVSKARLVLEQARLKNNKEAVDEAQKELDIKEIDLKTANTKRTTLSQIQPIEKQIAVFTQETALNNAKAGHEAKGFRVSADGTLKSVKATADGFQSYGNSLKAPLRDQDKMKRLAQDLGFEVKDTGKGYFDIGKTLKGSNLPPSEKITSLMGTTANATRGASKQAAGLTGNMNNAADAAEDFYFALSSAAGLPSARFAGGPVEAGQTYRINDGPSGMSLGQESFLSAAGVLSLINRPLNSTWTAPSRGTVIPANVTSRLKDAGALGGGAGVLRVGSDPAVAHLALAVGNLSQEVAELRRKAWNVSVGVGRDGSSLKLAQTVARMR